MPRTKIKYRGAFTFSEAAELLGVTRQTLWNWGGRFSWAEPDTTRGAYAAFSTRRIAEIREHMVEEVTKC
jgi:hypothetical protein